MSEICVIRMILSGSKATPRKSNSTLRTNSSRTVFSTQQYSASGVSGPQWRDFPQVPDDVRDLLRNVVDFGMGSPAAEPEPQRCACELFINPKCSQHVRRRPVGRRTRSAG